MWFSLKRKTMNIIHNIINFVFGSVFRFNIRSFPVIALLLVPCSILLSDNQYPFSYYEYEHLHGGEIIVTGTNAAEKDFQSFFIKPNWSEETDAIYTWKGLKRQNTKGASIGSAYVIANYPLKNNILSIWKENNRFFISLIDSNLTIINPVEINISANFYYPNKVIWLGKTGENEYGFILDQNFYICRLDLLQHLDVILISNDVLNAVSLYDSNKKSKNKAAYTVYKEGSGIVNFLSKNNEEIFSARIPVSEDIFIQRYNDQVAVISYSKSYPSSLVKIIDEKHGVIAETWIETAGDRIKIFSDGKTKKIYYINSDSYRYFLNYSDMNNPGKDNSSVKVQIPQYLIEPMGMWLFENKVIIIFRNGLTVFDNKLNIISVDFFSFGEYFNQDISLRDLGDYLV